MSEYISPDLFKKLALEIAQPVPKGLEARQHVRDSLRKFPHLHEIIADGFDYKSFCEAIDQDKRLSSERKGLTKALFNPDKRIGSAFMRLAQAAFQDQPARVTELGANDPLHAMWKEVWDDMHRKYAREVHKYDQKMAEKRVKRKVNPKMDSADPATEGAVYPHAIPGIATVPGKAANAFMVLGSDNYSLAVSAGFMDLPEDQKKAILYHEARHGFEPAIANADVSRWALHRMAANIATVNAASRKWESKADGNAAAFGHAESLAAALEVATESHMSAAKESLESAHMVAKAAIDNGFALDKRKIMAIRPDTVPAERTVRQQFFSPVVHLGKIATIKIVNMTLRKTAKTSPEQLLEQAMNPKWGPFNASTHPQLDERRTRLIGDGNARSR